MVIDGWSIAHEGLYRETAPSADLAGHIQCVWYRRVGRAEAAGPVRIVPDGCMDLLWMQGELRVAGPDTTVIESNLPEGAEIVGLRFLPGTASPVLGVPASELINGRVPARDVAGRWAAALTSRLETSRSDEHAAGILQEAVRGRLVDAPELDPLVQYVVRTVRRARPETPVRIARLAEQAGVSERQLHRRCRVALGYGAKTFARIVRFQHFVEQAQAHSPASLAQIAVDTGYADQAHLTREVRRLAGVAPSEVIAGRR